MIGRVLFRLARSRAGGGLVRFGFARAAWLLPQRRLAETERVIAFRHPRPSWPVHALLVPKASIPGFARVGPGQVAYLRELVCLADRLAGEAWARGAECVLVLNGGASQEVGQLHAHLIAGPGAPRYACPPDPAGEPLIAGAGVEAFAHPRPAREVHVVVRARATPAAGDERGAAMVGAVQGVVERFGLAERGYSVVLACGTDPGGTRCVHLVAGGGAPSSRPADLSGPNISMPARRRC